jgi:hypothetical protein
MFTTKQVHIFDPEKFAPGNFITYAPIHVGDFGESELGARINGIITHTEDKKIRISTQTSYDEIYLKDVAYAPERGSRRPVWHIFGVASAIIEPGREDLSNELQPE